MRVFLTIKEKIIIIKISFLVTNNLGNILSDWKEIKLTALRADIEVQPKCVLGRLLLWLKVRISFNFWLFLVSRFMLLGEIKPV